MLVYQRVICGELLSSFKHLPGFPAHCWKRDTMVEDTHQKSTMATVDFFLRTSPPPSMQPRPMVFGPVLWDKSPTKLFSSKKNRNWTRKCVWNCQQFHRSLSENGLKTSYHHKKIQEFLVPGRIAPSEPARRQAVTFSPEASDLRGRGQRRRDAANNATCNEHLKEDGV